MKQVSEKQWSIIKNQIKKALSWKINLMICALPQKARHMRCGMIGIVTEATEYNEEEFKKQLEEARALYLENKNLCITKYDLMVYFTSKWNHRNYDLIEELINKIYD